MDKIVNLTPQEDEVTKEVATVEVQANALKVIDTASYLAAGELWKSIKTLRAKIADTFDDIIKAAHLAHKKAIEKKKMHDDPLNAAERLVKKEMERFDTEQERIRKAEEDRLQKIAQKEAEDRRLEEALAAEKAGRKEEAAAIIETPVTIAPVVIAKVTPKMEGGPVYRTIWKFRIMNAALIPREYLMPDEVKIGGIVRSMKSAVSIPGIEAYEERC